MIPKYYQAPKPAVRIYPDGREVCNTKSPEGLAEYRARIAYMLMRQHGLCCLCAVPLRYQDAEFEHQDGRGMGGAHRDDRIEVDGKPYNGAACHACNTAKGSKRVKYHRDTPDTSL